MGKFNAVKVTLSTGKVVIMRELKISHTDLAAQEVAPKANGDATVLQLLMQKALVKNLLVQVNGQDVPASQREDLDNLFSMSEYGQLLKVIGKMSGGDDAGKFEPLIEVVNSGDN